MIANIAENERMAAYWSGRLRGFAIKSITEPNPYTAQDFADLAATGANIVRVPWYLTNVGGRYAYPTSEVAYLRQVLDYGSQYGFGVILVLAPLPGGVTSEWWASAQLQADIATNWVAVARVFKNHAALMGYDLINEPVTTVYDITVKQAWTTISTTIAQALRDEDPITPILWEPAWWAVNGSFWQSVPPAGVPHLVVSPHWYENQEITLQGLPGYEAAGTQPYPVLGEDYVTSYSRMVETRNFSRNYGLPVFVGEYSCVRWAPVGVTEAWLADAHRLFRAERWGTCFHAWRAYDGWDAEIAQSVPQDTGTSANRSSANPVITMLRAWFAAPRP